MVSSYYRRGWFKESRRHGLAAQGVKTAYFAKRGSKFRMQHARKRLGKSVYGDVVNKPKPGREERPRFGRFKKAGGPFVGEDFDRTTLSMEQMKMRYMLQAMVQRGEITPDQRDAVLEKIEKLKRVDEALIDLKREARGAKTLKRAIRREQQDYINKKSELERMEARLGLPQVKEEIEKLKRDMTEKVMQGKEISGDLARADELALRLNDIVLQTADLRKEVADLREKGATVIKPMQEERKAIIESVVAEIDGEKLNRAQLRKMREDMKAELDEVFGVEVGRYPITSTSADVMKKNIDKAVAEGKLPPEKAVGLKALAENYRGLRQVLVSDAMKIKNERDRQVAISGGLTEQQLTEFTKRIAQAEDNIVKFDRQTSKDLQQFTPEIKAKGRGAGTQAPGVGTSGFISEEPYEVPGRKEGTPLGKTIKTKAEAREAAREYYQQTGKRVKFKIGDEVPSQESFMEQVAESQEKMLKSLEKSEYAVPTSTPSEKATPEEIVEQTMRQTVRAMPEEQRKVGYGMLRSLFGRKSKERKAAEAPKADEPKPASAPAAPPPAEDTGKGGGLLD